MWLQQLWSSQFLRWVWFVFSIFAMEDSVIAFNLKVYKYWEEQHEDFSLLSHAELLDLLPMTVQFAGASSLPRCELEDFVRLFYAPETSVYRSLTRKEMTLLLENLFLHRLVYCLDCGRPLPPLHEHSLPARPDSCNTDYTHFPAPVTGLRLALDSSPGVRDEPLPLFSVDRLRRFAFLGDSLFTTHLRLCVVGNDNITVTRYHNASAQAHWLRIHFPNYPLSPGLNDHSVSQYFEALYWVSHCFRARYWREHSLSPPDYLLVRFLDGPFA